MNPNTSTAETVKNNPVESNKPTTNNYNNIKNTTTYPLRVLPTKKFVYNPYAKTSQNVYKRTTTTTTTQYENHKNEKSIKNNQKNEKTNETKNNTTTTTTTTTVTTPNNDTTETHPNLNNIISTNTLQDNLSQNLFTEHIDPDILADLEENTQINNITNDSIPPDETYHDDKDIDQYIIGEYNTDAETENEDEDEAETTALQQANEITNDFISPTNTKESYYQDTQNKKTPTTSNKKRKIPSETTAQNNKNIPTEDTNQPPVKRPIIVQTPLLAHPTFPSFKRLSTAPATPIRVRPSTTSTISDIPTTTEFTPKYYYPENINTLGTFRSLSNISGTSTPSFQFQNDDQPFSPNYHHTNDPPKKLPLLSTITPISYSQNDPLKHLMSSPRLKVFKDLIQDLATTAITTTRNICQKSISLNKLNDPDSESAPRSVRLNFQLTTIQEFRDLPQYNELRIRANEQVELYKKNITAIIRELANHEVTWLKHLRLQHLLPKIKNIIAAITFRTEKTIPRPTLPLLVNKNNLNFFLFYWLLQANIDISNEMKQDSIYLTFFDLPFNDIINIAADLLITNTTQNKQNIIAQLNTTATEWDPSCSHTTRYLDDILNDLNTILIAAVFDNVAHNRKIYDDKLIEAETQAFINKIRTKDATSLTNDTLNKAFAKIHQTNTTQNEIQLQHSELKKQVTKQQEQINLMQKSQKNSHGGNSAQTPKFKPKHTKYHRTYQQQRHQTQPTTITHPKFRPKSPDLQTLPKTTQTIANSNHPIITHPKFQPRTTTIQHPKFTPPQQKEKQKIPKQTQNYTKPPFRQPKNKNY